MNSQDNRLPSSLTTLSWTPNSALSIESTFHVLQTSDFKLYSFTLATISDRRSHYFDSLYSGIQEFFRFRGSTIKVLKFGFLDVPLLSTLLPYTSNLRSLAVQSDRIIHDYEAYSLEKIMNLLSHLPSTTPLHTLDIPSFPIDPISSHDFLVPLLDFPQLQKLKKLYCDCNLHIKSSCPGMLSFGRNRIKVDGNLSREVEKAVDLCRSRGVQLFLRSEEDERIARIRKQLEMIA